MKATYLIPTIKPDFCIKKIVNQIENLEKHDHEIIIISSQNINIENSNIKFVFDDKNIGSIYALNKGYKESSGDVIFVMVDDHSIPNNLLSIYKYFETQEFKNKKAKIANLTDCLGGPGYIMEQKVPAHKNSKIEWSLYSNIIPSGSIAPGPFPINFPYAKKYNVICFPVIFRETIDKYLGGVIYNEKFHQCYADHWLGFYTDYMLNQNDFNYGPKDIWLDSIPTFGNLVVRHEKQEIDKNIFLELVKNLMENKSTKYN